MSRIKRFLSYVLVFMLVTLSWVTGILPVNDSIKDVYADSTQTGDPDTINTGHNYEYNNYSRVQWGADGWVANSTQDRTLYIDLYDSNKTLKKTLSFATNFSIKDLGLDASTTEEFIYENEWLNGKDYSYAVIRCPGAFVQRNEANEYNLYCDNFAINDSDKHAYGEWTKVWENDRDIEHGHGGLNDHVGWDVYYKNYFMVWGETYNDSGYIKYVEGKDGYDSYNYFVSKGQSYTSQLDRSNINLRIYNLQTYKSLCAHIPFYTTNYINLRDTDTGKIREKQAFRGWLGSKWFAGNENSPGNLTMESFLIGLRLDETVPAITVSPSSSTSATTVKITLSDTGSGVKSGYTNGYQYYWSQSNTELKGGSWKSWSGNVASSSTSSIVSNDITIDGAYLWLAGASDNVDNIGNSGTGCTIKTINNQTYYVYGPYSKDYTQTLNFYKGTSLFSTKTYSIKSGEAFSPYDHRLDAGTPTNYHYSSVSKNPWTVTGAASASVYFAINQMKVIYDGNGATGGSTSGVNIDYGSNLTVASNGFSKTNFHFLKWNTMADGSGTSYSPGAAVTMYPSSHGQEYTLYAIWERDTYTQTINYYRYEYNNGTWSWIKDKTMTYTAGAGLTFNAASKAGAETISGYYYDHIDTGSWTVTGAATANAYFMPNTYRVSYNGNGATGGSTADTTGCTYSVPFALRNNGFTKTYYAFNGWNTKADGTGTYYSDGAQAVNLTTVKDGTAVLYAQWKDTTAPTVSVSETGTDDNWVLFKDVTITASDNGDGLSPGNTYRYCLCENDTAPDGTWSTYTNKVAFSIGAGLTGTYYLYVAPVADKAGNLSSDTYHKFGPYLFDNSAPADNIRSVYGWYESATEVDFGIHDDHSGISNIVIRDFHDIPVANITSSGKYTFDEDGENFYSIVITDNLGNTTTKAFMVKLSKHEEVIPKNAVWKGLDNLRVYAKWSPVTYNIVFDGNGATSGSTAAMRDLVYDTDYNLSANGFLRENYSFEGWNTRADGTGLRYADGQTVSNLSDTQGATVTLYAQWSDISAPQLDVNPSSCSDIVRNLDITITVDEKGSGLDSSNSYEYGLSVSPDVPPDTWYSYMDGTAPQEGFSVTVNIGSGLDGAYYLWVKQIKDSYGNTSVSDTCTDAVYGGVMYHVCGTYSFDNTAPAGIVNYTENNTTLGLYNETITDSPYAVMTVYDAADNLSGMKDITLEIWDAANEGNRTELAFIKNGTTYTCIFDLYNCLSNPQGIEKVRMRILATDNVGNTGNLQITSYDFGVMQSGIPISAECIGYREVNESHEGGNGSNGWIGSTDAYVYERDAFRVEAFVENISHHSAGTTFMGGHFGQLRIYTFGYVEIINADFGSLRNFIKPAYDTELNLPFTTIFTSASAHLYSHLFKIPLYCEPAFFTDTSVCGYKKNTLETRNVEYEVSDRIINHIKTILKYNVR